MTTTEPTTLRERLDSLSYTHQLRLVNAADRPSDSSRGNDTGWTCSAYPMESPCQGDGRILDVESRRWNVTDHTWGPWVTTFQGMCQNPEHRRNVATHLVADPHSGNFVAPAINVELLWTPVLDDARFHDVGRLPAEPGTGFADVVEVEQGLVDDGWNLVQSKVFAHLTSGEGDRYARRQSLRQLAHLGLFGRNEAGDRRLNTECRDLLTEYLDTVYSYCSGGRERFEAMLDGGEVAPRRPRYESEVIPEPAPAPAPIPFFADQRRTLSAEDIQNDATIPADTGFVTVESLVEAIKEYQPRYGLCDDGVAEFLDEFGIKTTTRKRLVIDFKDAEGARWSIIEMVADVPHDYELNEDLSDGDIDGVLNQALRDYLADHMPDHIYEALEDVKMFDSYSRSTDE